MITSNTFTRSLLATCFFLSLMVTFGFADDTKPAANSRGFRNVDVAEFDRLRQSPNAVILDVRSKGEYAGGHIAGSINISVDQLKGKLNALPDKQKAIITCCASGMRSATAKGILESSGYQKVFNGGSWSALKHKI